MGRISDKGVPMLTMHEKLVALAHCLARNWHEDAAGHLCDLLEHCRGKINDSHTLVVEDFKSLQDFVAYYGKDPTPIEEDPE